jgi:hypothetical protein
MLCRAPENSCSGLAWGPRKTARSHGGKGQRSAFVICEIGGIRCVPCGTSLVIVPSLVLAREQRSHAVARELQQQHPCPSKRQQIDARLLTRFPLVRPRNKHRILSIVSNGHRALTAERHGPPMNGEAARALPPFWYEGGTWCQIQARAKVCCN